MLEQMVFPSSLSSRDRILTDSTWLLILTSVFEGQAPAFGFQHQQDISNLNVEGIISYFATSNKWRLFSIQKQRSATDLFNDVVGLPSYVNGSSVVDSQYEQPQVNLYILSTEKDVALCFQLYETTFYFSAHFKEHVSQSVASSGKVLFSLEEKVKSILSECTPFFSPKEAKDRISILTKNNRGFELTELVLPSIQVYLDNNYNDDIQSVHSTITNSLKNEKSGVVLLHGPPGTGKTSYIRKLIRDCPESTWIFCPVSLAESLSGPDILPVLANVKKPVIVIEDAEPLIQHTGERNSSASTLLNLGDGLLGSALHTKLIFTINVEINNIDKALLRKGRLISSYKFDPLSAEKATALSAKLGKNQVYKKPVVLTEVFNTDSNNAEKVNPPKSTMGF